MAKKQVVVSLRKPPPPADLAALVVEASSLGAAANGTDAGPASDVRELRAEAPKADAFVGASRSVDLPGKRSITVQLPESTVDRLLAYCRLHERELNDVVAEIIARHLAAQSGSAAFRAFSFESLVRWVRAQLTLVASLRARVLQFAGM